MDIRKVKKLIELLEKSSVDEIEIHEGEGSVRITRRRETASAPVHHYHAAPAAAPPASMHAPAGTPAPGATADPGSESEDQLPPGYVVTSPMVGTFYQGLLARFEAVRLHRSTGRAGRYVVHHRCDENPQPDRVGGRRGGKGDHHRERPPGGVRRAAVRDRHRRVKPAASSRTRPARHALSRPPSAR